MTLKVGDRVKIIRGCKRKWCGGICSHIGRTGKITFISDSLTGCITVDKFEDGNDNLYCSGFDRNCFEEIKKIIKQYGIVKFLEGIKK